MRSDARPPNATRASTSRPLPSVPNGWSRDIDSWAPKSLALGSWKGRNGARTLMPTTTTSQPTARAATTSRRRRRAGRPGASTGSPPCTASSSASATASASGVGSMTGPRVEPLVEHVHGEVGEDVDGGDHCHRALEGDVLPLLDGLEDDEADAGEREHHF